MNVCELLQVRDGIDAKKQKLLEEYFQLDNQATELNQALQEKLGYRQQAPFETAENIINTEHEILTKDLLPG